MKIKYPVYDISGFELYYDEGDSSIYTYIPSKGGSLLIDTKSVNGDSLGIRRAVLRGMDVPLLPLRRSLPDVVSLVLCRANQIIDSNGNIFTIARKGRKKLKTYKIKEIYTSSAEEGKYVLVLHGHTKRIIVEELPPIGNIYVSLLQDERLGDIFAGYSTIPQEKMVRA